MLFNICSVFIYKSAIVHRSTELALNGVHVERMSPGHRLPSFQVTSVKIVVYCVENELCFAADAFSV